MSEEDRRDTGPLAKYVQQVREQQAREQEQRATIRKSIDCLAWSDDEQGRK